jgi:hypothetical protein
MLQEDVGNKSYVIIVFNPNAPLETVSEYLGKIG